MKKILLIIIIGIAFVLRFYHLGINPPSLYWDEVALGYNAYSISETARDEEGAFMPIQYFRSFGDFKPPVYIYSEVPMIKLFGLNEWTTRFPSAFFGSLSVIVAYLITLQLLKRLASHEPTFLHKNTIEWIALLAAFLFAISPWHTQISRVAYEANVALFLVLLGIYLFFKSLENENYKALLLVLSGISFVSTFYTFNSNRVFTPLMVILLAIIYRKQLFNDKKSTLKLLVASLISLAILLPLVPHVASHEGQLRYKEVNIFSDPLPVELSNERIAHLGNTWWAKILNNRRMIYAQNWIDGYFQHFSGKFLFISGDINPRFSLQDVGELYIIELPFLLIGLYLFLSRRKPEQLVILGWMFLAPVPAAFARETPHALRSLNILPTFQIIEAYAFIYVINRLNKMQWGWPVLNKKVSNFTVSSLLVVIFSGVILTSTVYYYLHNYYVHYSNWTSQEWQYGYKEMISEVAKVKDQYDRIIITDGQGRPYIETLFYLKYPPALFQKERKAHTDETGFGFITVDGFNKFEFRGINWRNEISKQQAGEKVLLVGTPSELTSKKYFKETINRLNGEPVFILSKVPTGADALIELGYLDENGNPFVK